MLIRSRRLVLPAVLILPLLLSPSVVAQVGPTAGPGSAAGEDATAESGSANADVDAGGSTAPDAQPGEAYSTPEQALAVDLTSPEATMFTFLAGMNHIEQGIGDPEAAWEVVVAALGRSRQMRNLPEAEQAAYLQRQAMAIKRVLDKLGTVTPEQLPDADELAGRSRFVYFPRAEHAWVYEALASLSPPREVDPYGIALVAVEPGRWRFSPETVDQADELAQIMAVLPVRHAPPAAEEDAAELVALVGSTFTQTDYWQWGVLLLAIFLGVVTGKIVQSSLRAVAERLRRHNWHARATIFDNFASPASLALLALGLTVGLGFVYLEENLEAFKNKVLLLLYIVALGWFLFNLVDLIEVGMRHLTAKTASRLDDMIVPLVRKTLRIFLVIVFAIFILQNVFELNITGFLAGLGIAGLAISLAAQDSVKNLFGSLTVFFDRPFAVGDFIVFGGHTGTVEEIGFRSTRIRLLSGHLVTVPNMKFIDGSIENIAARPYIRREMDVTITYDTPADKIEQAVQIVRDVLNDPEVVEMGRFNMEDNPPRVAFSDFNADSLNIKAFYWYQLEKDPDRGWFSFLDHAQVVNMKLFRAFDEAGIEFAFPTQTLYLAGDPKRRLDVHAMLENGSPTAPDGRSASSAATPSTQAN